MAYAQHFAYLAQWLIDDNDASMTIGDRVTLLLVDVNESTRAWYRAVLGRAFPDRMSHIVEALLDADSAAEVGDSVAHQPEQRVETGVVRSIRRIRYKLDRSYLDNAERDPNLQPTVVPGSVVVAKTRTLQAWDDADGYLLVFECNIGG